MPGSPNETMHGKKISSSSSMFASSSEDDCDILLNDVRSMAIEEFFRKIDLNLGGSVASIKEPLIELDIPDDSSSFVQDMISKERRVQKRLSEADSPENFVVGTDGKINALIKEKLIEKLTNNSSK